MNCYLKPLLILIGFALVGYAIHFKELAIRAWRSATVSGNEVHVLHVRRGVRLALGETPSREDLIQNPICGALPSRCYEQP